MDDLISKLSEIRSQYNCFDEAEEPYYRALSEAIKKLSERVDGDTISRRMAIDEITEYGSGDTIYMSVVEVKRRIEHLPSVQPRMSRWVRHDTGHSTYYDCYRCNCSAPCTETADSMLWKLSVYCPDCGAKMLNAVPHCIAEDLPSAQPQQVTEKLNSDCISRQEAIKELEELNAISFYELNEHSREAYREIKQMLKELPPAQTEQSVAQERYEDLCEYFGNDHDVIKTVLGDRKEFKAWLERLKWHVKECNKLSRQLEAQPEQKWIPCSDPSYLPKDKRLWITREISDGFFTLREVSDVIWDMTEWSGSVSGVVAYMPYWEPEPYTDRREK